LALAFCAGVSFCGALREAGRGFFQTGVFFIVTG
jgi:hypothetical protein